MTVTKENVAKPVSVPACQTPATNTDGNLPVLGWKGVRVVTTETLASGYGCEEKSIRMNLSRNLERFEEGKHYFMVTGAELKTLRATVGGSQISSKARALTLWTEKGAARMSKIVDTDEAWTFFEKLEDSYFRPKEASPTPAIPQSLPEALRLAAELAEQKLQLEHKLQLAAPKVEFAERVGTANGILIGNFAKVIGLKQNFLFQWLRDHSILIAAGSRRNVPKQQYIDQAYFSVREVVIDEEQHYRIVLTTQITGKGQQWLIRKLLEAGVLKPVPATL